MGEFSHLLPLLLLVEGLAGFASHNVRVPYLLPLHRPWDRVCALVDLVEVVKQSGAVCCTDLAGKEEVLPVLHDVLLVGLCQRVWTVVRLAVTPLDVPTLLADVLLELGDVQDKRLPEYLVGAHVGADELPVRQELRAQRVLHELARDDHPFRPMGEAEAVALQVLQGKLDAADGGDVNLGAAGGEGVVLRPPVPLAPLRLVSRVALLPAARQELDEVRLALRGQGLPDPIQAVHWVV
mmetsp:Transcript_152715/g.470225  ORF Transcript_152715/g.470225 Transcript_152715/m.470225 type:complete len:238 (+) Transcript_152715:282-995(+)